MKLSTKRRIAYALICALPGLPSALAQTPAALPQLDQMLAPVALYPDALLTQVLMASTFSLEVVQAARWAEQHEGLSGPALQDALQNELWDPSVKSLCAFPALLSRMSQDLASTQALGTAFLNQRLQVMDAVQRLRSKAQQAGHLQSGPQQTVGFDNHTITIQPADPQIVYMPAYITDSGWHRDVSHGGARSPSQEPQRETDVHAMQRDEAKRAFEFPAWR
jgi:hypothetical protein